MALFKDTPLTERLTAQFRVEVYNLPNHPNFASPLYPGFAAAADNNGIDGATGRGIGFLPDGTARARSSHEVSCSTRAPDQRAPDVGPDSRGKSRALCAS